jgi:hypothetical protein
MRRSLIQTYCGPNDESMASGPEWSSLTESRDRLNPVWDVATPGTWLS